MEQNLETQSLRYVVTSYMSNMKILELLHLHNYYKQTGHYNERFMIVIILVITCKCHNNN